MTYTNEAKQQMLGVSTESLIQFGAVSEAVVLEMTAGVLAHSQARITSYNVCYTKLLRTASMLMVYVV